MIDAERRRDGELDSQRATLKVRIATCCAVASIVLEQGDVGVTYASANTNLGLRVTITEQCGQVILRTSVSASWGTLYPKVMACPFQRLLRRASDWTRGADDRRFVDCAHDARLRCTITTLDSLAVAADEPACRREETM